MQRAEGVQTPTTLSNGGFLDRIAADVLPLHSALALRITLKIKFATKPPYEIISPVSTKACVLESKNSIKA